MNRKLLALALAVSALALGACGDDDEEAADTGTQPATTETAPTTPETTPPADDGASGGGTKLQADADPDGALAFTTDKLEAKAGKITITMDNPSPLPHAIGVEGNGVEEEGETVEKGGTSTVTVDLKPGEYQFYCPVSGHEEGGMNGTLTVR